MGKNLIVKIDRNELIAKLQEGLSVREIARIYKVANVTIHRLLDRYKIEIKVTTEIIDHLNGTSETQSPIEKKATNLLSKYNITNSPTPLHSIATKMGYTIKKQSYGNDLSAMLVKKTIYLNSDESEHRNNFSLAHEIGHIVLHSKQDHTYKPVRFRSDTFSDADKTAEKEANQFASYLLMPTTFLQTDLKDKTELSDSEIKQLAEKYTVSNQAMSIRLSNLGFEKLF